MPDDTPDPVQFAPSHVDGLPDIRTVAFHPDRVVLTDGASHAHVVWFRDLAPRTSCLGTLLRKLSRAPVLIGERDWFAPAPERFFRLASNPPLTLCMPHDDADGAVFRQVREIIRAGGFGTMDLG